MGPVLVLIGIALVFAGSPLLLFREYRRSLAQRRADDGSDRMPEARVKSARGAVLRSGDRAHRHRMALRTGLARGLLPGWAIAAALILLGVLLA